eukprot:jgi/Tetstr1/464501/TSEL_009259.t1
MEAAQVASEAAEPYAGAAEAEVDMQAAGNEESMPLPPPGSRPGPSRQTNRRSVGDSSQSALPRPDSARVEPPIELDNDDDQAAEEEPSHLKQRTDMLVRNLKATWGLTNKTKPVWSFFVPESPRNPDNKEDEHSIVNAATRVTCFVCYAAKCGQLHPMYPSPLDGDEGTAAHRADAAFWARPVPKDKLGREAKHTFDYKPDHGNTSLKYHVEHYHKEDLRKVTHYCLGDPDANKTSSKRSAAIAFSGDPRNTTTATKHTVSSHFMSTKKRPHDDKRVIFFWRLLCLLIVFCRLPFSIVQTFTLSKILNKLKSCITRTKKSSKGWHTLVLACREMRVKAVKFITPVK